MGNNLFSTYKTGENRVTAAILAVVRSLSLGRIERILGALMEQSAFELVRFHNQPSRGAVGVPDAEIVGSCRLLVETKMEQGMAEQADQWVQQHFAGSGKQAAEPEAASALQRRPDTSKGKVAPARVAPARR